ncbi:nicotinamide-nucleotide amidohydrolase family protein [Epilithonimonas sp.]|uniref:CinA family protein n=1 Tax=Epilithonimonas sp. TaxID=2894511 RepID=UPI0028ABDE98|nr:nicotinamide-nucleotide amidohydrolase family protein [Epilithonimonas sp.]
MEFPKILLDKISYYLIERSEKIAIAETVTSGFLQLAFSQMPDAEEFFSGGITTFSNDEKIRQFGLDAEESTVANFVSEEITEQMAISVSEKFGTEWAISTTGYAVPVAESEYEIFAYYSIAYRGEVILSDKIELHPLTKAIDAQNYFAECILSGLRCELKRNLLQVSI